jgi:hypothetical protein
VHEAVRRLLAEGVTVPLTTQYLEEADALADRIVVIDKGRVAADDTPRELKEASRGARLEVTLAAPSPGAGVDPVPGLATSVVRALDRAGIAADNVEVRQPSLDDVFFALTGPRPGTGSQTNSAPAAATRRKEHEHDHSHRTIAGQRGALAPNRVPASRAGSATSGR